VTAVLAAALWFIWPVVAIVAVGLGVVAYFLRWPTGAMRAQMAAAERDADHRGQGLTLNEQGVLACPKCGGTQFKLRRTAGQRVAVGSATVLFGLIGAGAGAAATDQRVQCVTCGLFYEKADG
jgi:hypothetical protein